VVDAIPIQIVETLLVLVALAAIGAAVYLSLADPSK